MPVTRAVWSDTGSPHAFSARYASCRVAGVKPSVRPRPWQIIRSLRRAVTAGFFCRSEPGRAVARIGERRLALGDQPGVEVLEVGEPEEHLAAHLEHRGYRVFVSGGEPFRDVVDGARVERDVLAGAAVAAGGARGRARRRGTPAPARRRRSSARTGYSGSAPISLVNRAAHAASSSGLKTLSRLSIRSRWSAAAKSVAKPAPPTSCVGESGVRSSG